MAQNLEEVDDRTVPENAEEAANWLNLDTGASRDEINDRFRDLTLQYHPDGAGSNNTTDNFLRLQNARDMLLREPGEMESEQAASEARRGGPETGTSSPFTNAEDTEQFNETKEAVKLMMIEDATGQDMGEYDSVDDAINSGALFVEQVERVNTRLQQKYEDPSMSLDKFAGILATLVVSGAVDLGDMGKMAEETGFFTKGTRRGSGSGFFQSRGRGGGGDNFFG